MPRFVILRHEMPPGSERPMHWDLMLENGPALRTWALDIEPSGNCAVQAVALADHRLAYLDYEGPVSGDRGEVTRWDVGEFEWLELAEQKVSVTLRSGRGERLVTLEQVSVDGALWVARFFQRPALDQDFAGP